MGIIEDYYDNSDQRNAKPMASYMKNKFPYLGIPKPKRKELEKSFIKQWKKKREIYWEFVNQCWELPEREFQYLGVDYLLALKKNMVYTDIKKIEKLIVDKSWWDTVDMLAAGIIGELCTRYPYLIEEYIMKWSADENIWLKRTALLFQLKYKDKTDMEVLEKVIIENKDTKEFFINKAIGWILREFSKTNREWVRDFIAANNLHPLSVREGSKYL